MVHACVGYHNNFNIRPIVTTPLLGGQIQKVSDSALLKLVSSFNSKLILGICIECFEHSSGGRYLAALQCDPEFPVDENHRIVWIPPIKAQVRV